MKKDTGPQQLWFVKKMANGILLMFLYVLIIDVRIFVNGFNDVVINVVGFMISTKCNEYGIDAQSGVCM